MYSWLLFLSLTVCAKVPIDTRGVDTPRGWTIDKSSDDVTAGKAFDQGKTLTVDSFDSEEGITTKAMMTASDSIENIKNNIDKFKKLIAVNIALRNAVTERENSTAFIRNYTKQLEVRVYTRLSPLRAYLAPDDSLWPRIEVDLGDEAGSFPEAKVIDGGAVVFHRTYQPDLKKPKDEQFIHMINSIQKLTVRLATHEGKYSPVFTEFKDDRGHKICRERHGITKLWSCKEYYNITDSYYEEANRVFIDRVEVVVKIDNTDKEYKIFSDNTKIELRSFLHEHTFNGFKQNPHWILHAYSSKSTGWQGDHDGSEFAKKVWERIENNDKIAPDVYWEVFQCTNQGLSPILVTPELPSPEPDSGEAWANKNAPFAPKKDADNCEPITSESIAKNALPADSSCLEGITVPDNLNNHSKEELDRIRAELQNIVNKGEQSNQTLKEELDDLIKTGCLYDKPLTDGIRVEIEGQLLISAAGKYMTSTMFKERHPKEAAILPQQKSNIPLYINLGLDKRSYLIMKNFHASGDGLVKKTAQSHLSIDPTYTRNFTMRALSFVHFMLGGNPQDRFQPAMVEEKYQASPSLFKKILTPLYAPISILVPIISDATSPTQQSIKVKTFNIEYVVNIHRIALYNSGNDNPFYTREVSDQSTDEATGVRNSLFTLNSITSSWTDYNIKDNLAWKKRRKDSCSD